MTQQQLTPLQSVIITKFHSGEDKIVVSSNIKKKGKANSLEA